MGVCDVPVIHEVCNAAGDAAGAVITAPFDWLAQGMGGAAEWMFKSVWKVIDTTTFVDVTSGEYGDLVAHLVHVGAGGVDDADAKLVGDLERGRE